MSDKCGYRNIFLKNNVKVLILYVGMHSISCSNKYHVNRLDNTAAIDSNLSIFNRFKDKNLKTFRTVAIYRLTNHTF